MYCFHLTLNLYKLQTLNIFTLSATILLTLWTAKETYHHLRLFHFVILEEICQPWELRFHTFNCQFAIHLNPRLYKANFAIELMSINLKINTILRKMFVMDYNDEWMIFDNVKKDQKDGKELTYDFYDFQDKDDGKNDALITIETLGMYGAMTLCIFNTSFC